jgi:hypothetical protein
MRRWLLLGLLCVGLPLWAQSERESTLSDADILFNEIVPLAAHGGALDVSFVQGNLEVVKMNRVAWVLDPRAAGLHAVACRPIPETAKAGESLTWLGEQLLRGGEAVHVRDGQDGAFVLTSRGTLIRLVGGEIDSVSVARGLGTAADVDANPSGLLAVLWGREVRVFLGFGWDPFLEFSLEDDLQPAVAVAVSAAGRVFVAGRGETAVAAYDFDAKGEFQRVRSVPAAELQIRRVGGMDLSPFMLLPSPGREGWADQDRFVLLSDVDGGGLLALEAADLSLVGRWDLRAQLPGVAPGRLDVSNRGQVGIVDQRTGEALVLPTGVMTSMVQGVEGIRWRVLEPTRTFKVQGGDTLQLPHPRHE